MVKKWFFSSSRGALPSNETKYNRPGSNVRAPDTGRYDAISAHELRANEVDKSLSSQAAPLR